MKLPFCLLCIVRQHVSSPTPMTSPVGSGKREATTWEYFSFQTTLGGGLAGDPT